MPNREDEYKGKNLSDNRLQDSRKGDYSSRDNEEFERRETDQYFRKRQSKVVLLKILILLAIILGITIIVVISVYT
jgi:hypothetical protein